MSEVQIVIDQSGDVQDFNLLQGAGPDIGGLGIPSFAAQSIDLSGGTVATLDATDVGQIHETSNTIGGDIFLPLANTTIQGARIMIRIGVSTAPASLTTIRCQGADVLQGGVSKINGGDGLLKLRGTSGERLVFNEARKGHFVFVESDGISKWFIIDGVSEFSSAV